MTKKKVFEVYVNPDCVRIDNAFNNLLKQVGDHVEFELPDWFNKWKPPYTFIKRNLYLTKKIKRRIEDDGIFCSCKPSSASSSVCGRDCHCGMLLSSCSSSCKCGSSCINKPFHQRPVKKMKLVKAATKISALKQLQSALGVPQDDLDMLNLDIHQAEEAVTTPCEEFDLPPIPTPYMGSRKGVRVDPIMPSNSSIRSEEAEADDDEESDASRGVSEEGSGSTDSALLQEDTGGPQGSVDQEPVGGHGEQVENLEPIVSANQVAQVSIQGATGDVGGAQLQATNAEAQPQTSNIPDVPQDSSPSPARVSPRLDDPFVDSHAKRRKGSSGIGDTALEAAAATALLQVSLALVSLPESSTALPLSSIPLQHGAVEVTGVAGSRMVNFKGGLVNPRVPAIIERVQAKFPTTFSNLKCRSPHFVSLTYESMARTVSVLDKHSMNTISSKDLKFLESTISDMELNGADVSWLKAPMDVLRQMKVLGDRRLAVERLEAAAAEAAKVAKATKKAAEEAQKKAEEAQRKAEEAANLLEAEGTLETEKCGSGVVADEDIKRGEFVIEYVGEVIDDKTCEERLWEMKRRGETNFYLCEINRDMVIDATYKGNKSRYINHSCCPNTEMQKWRIDGETRIGIFATRDINKGDHLTYDYQFVQFGADQDCHCGASGCRQKLGVKPSKPKISSEAALKLVVCQVAVSSPKLKAISSGNDVYQNGGLHIGNLQHAPNKQRTQCRNCIGEVIVITRPINKRYFGIIKRFDKFSRKHSIMFEDGRVEFLDMSKEEWEFVNLL